MPALSEIRIRNAKSRDRAYKLFDELGLFLLVMPSATQRKGRLWRLRYRYGNAEKLLSLGAYPDVSLKRAREKRDEARWLLADGVDPSVHRKIAEESRAETFEVIAREWLAMRAKTTAAVTQAKALWLMEMLFPYIGRRPIREVTPPELLSALRKIEARGGTTNQLTGPSRNVGRYFGTPLLPGGLRGTSARICVALWCRWSLAIMLHSPIPPRSAPYSAPLMGTKVTIRIFSSSPLLALTWFILRCSRSSA